jgi:hypothetical protein
MAVLGLAEIDVNFTHHPRSRFTGLSGNVICCARFAPSQLQNITVLYANLVPHNLTLSDVLGVIFRVRGITLAPMLMFTKILVSRSHGQMFGQRI